ncbi:MAG TPA: FG-GAP-like repeat-containing protein [Gemmatimonadaceae bacterium]|nr:FG-GAP-like repeat-containing protein [Gemmatimonadaceae bacterium]
MEELYAARMAGLSYLQRNQLAEAESAFRKITELAPDDPLGYANLGLTYLQSGRLPNAEQQLRRARELDPGSAEVGLALARLYSLTGRPADARAMLEQLRRDTTGDAHVLYALAELDAGQTDSASARRYEDRLREVLAVAPANLVARLKLADAFARRGAADSAVRQLEEARRIPPEPPKEARARLDSAIQLLRAGQLDQARSTMGRFVGLMEVTQPYQASLEEVKWTEGPIPGRLVLSYSPKDFVSVHGVRERAAADLAKLVDATSDAGLDIPQARASGGAAGGGPAALAAGDVDGDGRDDLFVSAWSPAQGRSLPRLYRVQGGFLRDATDASGIALPQGASYATFADYDNDGWLDLFAIDATGGARLFRNRGNGTFVDETAKAGLAAVAGARKAVLVDLDHDGDLDLLLLASGGRVVYRNNLDGTFAEATAGFGMGGPGVPRDAAFADFDGDGRVDLFVANESGSDALLRNGGAQRFADVTAPSGLTNDGGSGAAAVGDYDNDGFLDLFVARASGGEPALWRNGGGGTFARDRRSAAALRLAGSAAVLTATFVDYDNDGWLDLVVGTAAGVLLFRNDGAGRLLDRSAVVAERVRAAGASAIAVSDVDGDGDEDLWLLDAAGAPRLLRNDLGNSNLGVNVELKALRAGSGKNNALGIGARLELRAGELFQTRVATGRVTHFGLGPHLKADVLRVEWPNGVPQTVYVPGSDQDVVEREVLKGSCAFAYSWDGTRFRFVTDAMWRSALGMPLGLMGSTSAFAPAGASQEYVRIAGDALRPRDGRYVLQLTEELWETAYADQVKLLAVDHPDSVEVFVDERFVPPGPVSLRLFQLARRDPPVSATDERGRDVLPALRESDDVYVSDFTPTRYQGVVEPHDLVLDLGEGAGRPGTFLFLRGWIYPTDASINVALSQQSAIRVAPPSLEVRDAAGKWRTAVADIGFPSGKDKTIVVELAGKFPTADHRVRIRTSMQIYWDQAFVARALDDGPAKVTALSPVSADLHARGFSRMYRRGGRYGPYWFAYEDVAKESPWRPIEGAFTRFGDVLPLLREPDDMYVVMAPGDETTIEFDASSERSLPPGWRRDFLLYTDGWIKDSDLNTAFGTTVGPLPFHAVKSYPYAPGESYPTDAQHQRYLREYNTRIVRRHRPSAGTR